MNNILISTIVRNREKFLDYWFNQLKQLVILHPNYNFYLSVYENDSIDNSREKLLSFDYSFLKDSKIECGSLNIPYFGSIKHDIRVQYLAQLRNRTLFNNTFLNICDYVISIEPDIKYNPADMISIIENKSYDILSARSIEITPPPPHHLYDGWGTRIDNKNEDWPHNIDLTSTEYIDVWSTYNCFCKYKAEPIKNKIAFEGFNKRLNKFDCDTAVICENFREAGFSKIGLYTKALVFHER